jgi:hypothetical protein
MQGNDRADLGDSLEIIKKLEIPSHLWYNGRRDKKLTLYYDDLVPARVLRLIR